MSSEIKCSFTKDNIDTYLKEVSKIYRKLVGKKLPAEIILIGGASILINYSFRNSTADIDAIIESASAMEDAIKMVRDKNNLSNDWLNSDFSKTSSFSPKIAQYSKFYKTYSNIVTVRTINSEYLIAMKLRAGRQYKHDLSDILGILLEHEKKGTPITIEQIHEAIENLYGSWKVLSNHSIQFIEGVFNNSKTIQQQYEEVRAGEIEAREKLIALNRSYPDVLTSNNVDTIAYELQKRTDRNSLLNILRKR